MTSVLVIGYAPDAVDFSDPMVPKGMTQDKVAAGIDADQRKLSERGWDAEHMNIHVEDDVRNDVLGLLARKSFDCIVVGGGVRATTKHTDVLEAVVNAVRESAPGTPIAFNDGPDKSAEAVARVLSLD